MSTPLRLLIVDDEDAFRLALEAAMADSGYNVKSSSNVSF
jgi:DNA-binding NtrC family response regulator